MRRKNLDIAEALGEDVDVTEEEANEARTIVTRPAAPPAPSQPFVMTAADLNSLVATAVAAASQGNQALADVVTKGIAQARQPIPEGTDQSNPRISHANPLGDRDHPRPLLKCEIYLGIQEPKSKQISRTYPFAQEDLTVHEILALNTLQPGNYTVALHDGTPIKVAVVPENDAASDALMRLVIVVPATVTGKGSALKNMLPGACNLVEQITGHNFSKKSKDDLAWLMAEHRAGRYVAEREAVAA